MSNSTDIDSVAEMGISSWNSETKKKAIDTLVTFGKSAIPLILEVANSSYSSDVKQHGLGAIQCINSSNRQGEKN